MLADLTAELAESAEKNMTQMNTDKSG